MTPFAEKLVNQLRQDPNLRLTAIVEMAHLTPPRRQRLAEYFAQSAYPILHQDCFSNIRDIGPWLLSSGERVSLQGQFDFHCEVVKIAGDAQCGWLVSTLEPSRLAHHLGQANIARGPDGDTCLLRFYAEWAFPVLHARRDLQGIAELLEPIRSWWVMTPHFTPDAWLQYPGNDRPERSGISSLQLDQACWDALRGSPLAYRLADLLEETLAAANPQQCRGTRLSHVDTLLAEARKNGLSRPEDLSDYVIFLTRHGHALRDKPAWQAILADVRDNGQPLAQALKRRLS